MSLIGGDRQASRSEIRKLALYAHGKERVELDDVLAVVADASALALERWSTRRLPAAPARPKRNSPRRWAPARRPAPIVSTALRHVAQMHRARLAVDGERQPTRRSDSFVPPLHFSRKPQVEAALKSWTAARLARAMAALAEAAHKIRKLRTPIDGLADPIAQRAMLSIATSARRKDR